MRLMIAAGGTGGHIFPAIAIAQEVECRGGDVVIVGSGSPVESKILQDTPFRYEVVPFEPVVGKGIQGLVRCAFALPRAVSKVRSLLKDFRPDVVLGCGGYPSFMPVVIARLSGVDTAIFEPNIHAGLANRVLSVLVRQVFAIPHSTGFKCSERKITRCQIPVRKQFYEYHADVDIETEGKGIRVLIVGGSQGSVALNEAVLTLSNLFESYEVTIVHQTGSKDFEHIKTAYEDCQFNQVLVASFFDEMWKEYRKADLVICRAGAMTVAEISAVGLPAVFVPLPGAEGHQSKNAEPLLKAGVARIVKQDEQFAGSLWREIQLLLGNRQMLTDMATKGRAFAKLHSATSVNAIIDGLFIT